MMKLLRADGFKQDNDFLAKLNEQKFCHVMLGVEGNG